VLPEAQLDLATGAEISEEELTSTDVFPDAQLCLGVGVEAIKEETPPTDVGVDPIEAEPTPTYVLPEAQVGSAADVESIEEEPKPTSAFSETQLGLAVDFETIGGEPNPTDVLPGALLGLDTGVEAIEEEAQLCPGVEPQLTDVLPERKLGLAAGLEPIEARSKPPHVPPEAVLCHDTDVKTIRVEAIEENATPRDAHLETQLCLAVGVEVIEEEPLPTHVLLEAPLCLAAGVETIEGEPMPTDVAVSVQQLRAQEEPAIDVSALAQPSSLLAAPLPGVRDRIEWPSDLIGLSTSSYGKEISRQISRRSAKVACVPKVQGRIPRSAPARRLFAGSVDELGASTVVRRHIVLYSTRMDMHRRPLDSGTSALVLDSILFSDVREFRTTSLGFELHLINSIVRQFSTPKADFEEWRDAWSQAVSHSGLKQGHPSARAPEPRRQSMPSMVGDVHAEGQSAHNSVSSEVSTDTCAGSGVRSRRSSSVDPSAETRTCRSGRKPSVGLEEFERGQVIHSTRSTAEPLRRTACRGRAAPSLGARGVVRQHRHSSLERPAFR
jgi:hypothetical protein